MWDHRGYLYRIDEIIPGTNLRVRQPLGAGGMGSVYEVSTPPKGERYVVKVVHPHLLGGMHIRERLRREVMVLTEFEHPHIVKVLSAGETADDPPLPYYVMERLYGCPLSGALQRFGGNGLPLGTALEIGVELLRALSYAHRRGVVHRDVKPDNVFLHFNPDGVRTTKLLDFGVVRILSEARATLGGFIGTLGCASPEQLRNEDPTPACDIYAAGITLYEMLTGHEPFGELADLQSIIEAHLHRSPIPPSAWRTIPPVLDALVLDMVAKSPLRRPAADDVVLALERLGSLIRAEPGCDTQDGARWWRAIESDLRTQAHLSQVTAAPTAISDCDEAVSEPHGAPAARPDAAGAPCSAPLRPQRPDAPRRRCRLSRPCFFGSSHTGASPVVATRSAPTAFAASPATEPRNTASADPECPIEREVLALDRLRTRIVLGALAGVVLGFALVCWLVGPPGIESAPTVLVRSRPPSTLRSERLEDGCKAKETSEPGGFLRAAIPDLPGPPDASQGTRAVSDPAGPSATVAGERPQAASGPTTGEDCGGRVGRAPARAPKYVGNARGNDWPLGAGVLVAPDWNQIGPPMGSP